MISDHNRRDLARKLTVAALLLAAGLALSGISLIKIARNNDTHLAQATQPLQGSPAEKSDKPAESKPGGERPTTPAPEPAQPPDPQTRGEAVKPALPATPAEKIAPPIQQK